MNIYDLPSEDRNLIGQFHTLTIQISELQDDEKLLSDERTLIVRMLLKKYNQKTVGELLGLSTSRIGQLKDKQ